MKLTVVGGRALHRPSPLARGRGLKQPGCEQSMDDPRSPLARGRGLKPRSRSATVRPMPGRPSRGGVD